MTLKSTKNKVLAMYCICSDLLRIEVRTRSTRDQTIYARARELIAR